MSLDDVEMGDGSIGNIASQGVANTMNNLASNPNAYTMSALFPANKSNSRESMVSQTGTTMFSETHADRVQSIMSAPSDQLSPASETKMEDMRKAYLGVKVSKRSRPNRKKKPKIKKSSADGSIKPADTSHNNSSMTQNNVPSPEGNMMSDSTEVADEATSQAQHPAHSSKRKREQNSKASHGSETFAGPVITYVRPAMIIPGSTDLDRLREYLQKAKNDVERLKVALTKQNELRIDRRTNSVEKNLLAKATVLAKQTKSAISKTQNPKKSRLGGRQQSKVRRAFKQEQAKNEIRLAQVESDNPNFTQGEVAARSQSEDQGIGSSSIAEPHSSEMVSEMQDQEMAVDIQDDETTVTSMPQGDNRDLEIAQSCGHKQGRGKPGKAAFRTLNHHLQNNIFDAKTLDAVKDISALDNGNNNIQAIRVLRRNLDNILYTFGEQSDQYQNFKFMVEESIVELESKMSMSLQELDARDAAREAKRTAGLAKRERKEVLRATRKAFREAQDHELNAIKTFIQYGDAEQKALAEARFAEMRAESVQENPRYLTRTVMRLNRVERVRKKRQERLTKLAEDAPGQQDDGGVALPLSMDEDADGAIPSFKMEIASNESHSDDSDDNSSEDDEEDHEIGGVALMQDDIEKLNALRALLGDMQINTGRT